MYPYLFFIGDFPVRAYGMVMMLSIISATIVAYFLAKQDGRWHQHVPDFGICCGFAGLVGARLWDVFFFDWSYYQYHLLEIPFVWQGGMSIQGGVVFGALAGYWYTKRHGIDTWAFADIAAAPAVIFGQALGRAANLLNGDAFGRPTGENFGIIYPVGSLAQHTYGMQPLWPAEIWEGQLDLVIFVVLLLLRTTNHRKGQVFACYVFLYSAARFGLEFLRGDYGTLLWGLKSAQLTGGAMAVLALLVFVLLGRYGKPIRNISGN